jgi:penicillin-binding protein 2
MHQEADRVRSFSRRALVVGGAQLALFGGLVARLYHLQVQENSNYKLLAEDNRVNQRLIIPARGRIFDRVGRPLAINVPTYRVRIVREDAKDVEAVLRALAQLIPLEPQRIDDIVRQARVTRAFVPLTIQDGLSWEDVSTIAVHSPELPGVLLDSGLLRQYPERETVSHVLGYLGPPTLADVAADPNPLLSLPDFRLGKNGIEKSYDTVLRGRSGRSRVEVNAIGREIRELDRADGQPGQDLQLSLDLELQKFCFDRMGGELAASAVVVEVDTGAVLALASVPSFDPRAFQNGLSRTVWQELRDNPRTPLVNKCIRGQYPPGSTFKMMTGLAALEAGVATPSSGVFCPGYMALGNFRFHCWKEHGHGSLVMTEAFEQSCDVFFYEMARRVGIDAISAMGRRFGLGHPLGLDIPGEQPGLMPTVDWKRARFGQPWQKGETLVCGIGQGYILATPLQLAVMTARLCNGGRAVRPWFDRADAIPDAEVQSIGVSKAHLAICLKGMRDVIHGKHGTAKKADLHMEGIEMGGKTGTAQVRRITKAERAAGAHKRKDIPWEERDHALFVCFAPYAAPRYAVSIIVEHGAGGATVAAPIARDIMRRTLEIAPTGRDLKVSSVAFDQRD